MTAKAPAAPFPAHGSLAWLLGTVYATLTLLLVYRTSRYGMQYPYSDDWLLLPQWLGLQPLSWESLLAHHNEHRIPLQRLYWIAVFRLTGGDLRWMVIANTFLLATAGLLLNGAIARTRGSLALSDALVPIALLGFTHGGHLWLFQASFAIPVCGIIVVMSSSVMLTAATSNPGAQRAQVGILFGLSVLALSGAAGVVVASVVAIYLCLDNWWLSRAAQPPRQSANRTFVYGLVIVIMICIVIAATTPKLQRPWASPTVGMIGSIALQMLVAPLGTKSVAWWPWTLILPALLLGTYAWHTGILIARGTADAALGTLRIGIVLLSMLVLYLTLGVGRAGREVFPMHHYGLLGLPLYLGLYAWASCSLGVRCARSPERCSPSG